MSWKTVGLKRMLLDWISDPIRRRNVLFRVVESVIGGGAMAALVGLLRGWSFSLIMCVPIVPIIEFLVYEFIFEPLGLSGPYWERGPRDNETFIKW